MQKGYKADKKNENAYGAHGFDKVANAVECACCIFRLEKGFCFEIIHKNCRQGNCGRLLFGV